MHQPNQNNNFLTTKTIFYAALLMGILIAAFNFSSKDENENSKNHNKGKFMHNDQYGIPGTSIGRPGWTGSSREANGIIVVQQDNRVFRIQGTPTSSLESIDGKIYVDKIEVKYGDSRILSISDNDSNRPVKFGTIKTGATATNAQPTQSTPEENNRPAFNVAQQSRLFRTTEQQETPQPATIPVTTNAQPRRAGGLRIGGSFTMNGKTIPKFETQGPYADDVTTINGETMIGRNDGKVITVRGGSISALGGHLVIDGTEVTSDSDPRIVSIEDGASVHEVVMRRLSAANRPGF